jgi:hypothetical protein
MDENFEKKDDLKTTISPDDIIKEIKEKLPELKEIEVFGNKFTNVQAIFWLCIICLPLIIIISFKKNELWSLLNIFWCLGLINYLLPFNFFNPLIYSNFGNILFQLFYILFYIWDLGKIYQLEGETGKTIRNWTLFFEFILILIELILLAFLLKNDTLKRKEIPQPNVISINGGGISDSGNYESPVNVFKPPKPQIEEPKRYYPSDNIKNDNRQGIRRFEDEVEP